MDTEFADEVTGTAPVAFRVDVTDRPVAEAIRVHWELNTWTGR
jgi:hypothetical protein